MSHLELNFSFSYKSNIECTNFTRVCTRHQTKTKHVKHSFHTCTYTFLGNTENNVLTDTISGRAVAALIAALTTMRDETAEDGGKNDDGECVTKNLPYKAWFR